MAVKNVILSGGVGSRLWPLSRKSKPKQYLEIFQGDSLFSLTINRNKKFVDGLIVISSLNNSKIGEKWLENLGLPVLSITESLPRNTAAAISLACFAVDEEDILLVTPSDHIINNEDAYEKAVQEAIELATQGYIVTFGLKPNKPETGYGYIEYEGNNVLRFREKPNRETAIEFVKSGRFMWNSGMFCFKVKTLLEELAYHDPEIFLTVKNAWENRTADLSITKESMTAIPSRSIDYAVMEKSKKIKMVKSDFFWSDLGAFDSLYDYLISKGHSVDESGNMYIGNDQKHIQFIGLENSILVNTDDVILILNKENSQDVKQVYEELEKNNSSLI
ncbi:mannose-1-phosphate guanylyltransferase [Chryseobacterium oranimense]|uniref:mannose-1-phosphate guanylyltransferase n=1 Tax=Chryseobacterium oranimense TaxID=421058 RepID=UPI002235C1EA|nr:sugar phosphate nucleotidyltransferase [Chryseobacterium oranimense]